MFPNVSIKKMLIRTGMAIVLLTLCSLFVSFYQLNNIKDKIYEKENEVLPHTINFLKLQNDVVQVQQWLTDISATRAYQGFDDGFNEAKKYYDDGNKILDHLITEHEKYNEQKMVNDIKEFKSNFDSFYKIGIEMANAYIKGGPELGNKMMLKLDPFAVKLTDALEVWLKEHLEENEKIGENIKVDIITINFLTVIFGFTLILFIIFIFWLISTKIGSYILDFQNGLLHFFKFLNKGTETVPKLNEKGDNEISAMATVINENIEKTQKLINADTQLISEAKVIIQDVKDGIYSNTIKTKTPNQSLDEFKNGVNDMILTIKEHFTEVNNVLEEYANYNYKSQLNIDGIVEKSDFDKVIKNINILKNSITEMLVKNRNNGLILQESANKLLENVDTLNSSSNQAAASLEETAAALEELTSTVNNNTEKITTMSMLASKVTSSASDGEELANKTTNAMDEINKQVNLINDAISVVDQIAFQTNILSLNAAVEAATAGEAGKGFAVVAQEVRNLAARSADAAKEIKELVENATSKANEGKNIADLMINGYVELNSNIDKTLELINDVSISSKEQQEGIVQINDAINSLDQQTQQNASVANDTKQIAVQTDAISQLVVEDTNKKEFDGKEIGKIKKDNINYNIIEKKVENREKENSIKKESKDNFESTKNIVPNNTDKDDEWESF